MNALHEFKNSHHVLEFVLLTSALLIFRAISFFVVGDRHVHFGILSSTSGFYLLDARSTAPAQCDS